MCENTRDVVDRAGQRNGQNGNKKIREITLSDFYWYYNGAGDGFRTRDPKLGKLVLYQLSYARFLKK